MFFTYQTIILLITIISPLIILIRLFKKKEDFKRFKEKFCFFSKKKIRGKLIWFHGASVGEILSVIPLIEKLEKNKKIQQILITSNTLSSSKILSKLKLKKTVHQFFPIDNTFHTKKFLEYWKPSMAVFIDSEIWPNMIINIKKKNIPLILLNARITKKSFLRWKKFIHFANHLFKNFDICFPSNEKSKKYLKILGAKKIKFIGNLKFSQGEKEENYISGPIKKDLLSRKIWCASSTHNTEEKYCGIVHKKLKIKYKNLLTIIIPRHIDRTDSILDEMKKLDLKVQLDDTKKIDKNTDIYLVNSYGKTKSFFKICKTVFLGGSIIKHGGQNPIEAVKYGCKVLHGPNVWNFDEIYNLLDKYGSSKKISKLNELKLNVDKSFKNKNNSKKIKSKIENLGNKILHLTLKELNFFLINNENKKT
jgi:3-deoxy-D-manno-octulosonic-acid transferase